MGSVLLHDPGGAGWYALVLVAVAREDSGAACIADFHFPRSGNVFSIQVFGGTICLFCLDVTLLRVSLPTSSQRICLVSLVACRVVLGFPFSLPELDLLASWLLF